MKHRTHKLAAKTVAAILCAALMLTACGSKETTSNETASTETTSVESTEMTTTEAAVAEPAVEPTEAPVESETAPTETAPAESPAPAVEPTAAPAATPAPAQTTTTGSSEPYFDRTVAEQVFALVNNDRVANGLPALTWNEDMYNIAVQRCYEGAAGDIHGMMRNGTSENRTEGQMGDGGAQEIYQSWYNSTAHRNNYLNATYTSGAVAVYAQPCPIEGLGGPQVVAYEVFTWDNTATNSSVTINTPAAAPKTADENTDTSSSNVGWSMTPPTQEDGLKKWQEQNPDAEVSFGN